MCHLLSPTYGDNVLCLDRATLIPGIMEGYKLDIAKWIATEIHNWMVSPNIVLAFPFLLTWICLDKRVP